MLLHRCWSAWLRQALLSCQGAACLTPSCVSACVKGVRVVEGVLGKGAESQSQGEAAGAAGLLTRHPSVLAGTASTVDCSMSRVLI